MNVLITGGAGFIGCNAAAYYLRKKNNVTIFDNFSRLGSERNSIWLQEQYPQHLEIVTGEITGEQKELMRVVGKADLILHLAGQVAVTTSVNNPRNDFEINALGTLNVLEAMRLTKSKAILLYSSTNKVYGGLEDIPTVEKTARYEFESLPFGISEERNLDFHSPYGCSKGAADQYVRDYARIYDLNTIVFRQSCIYGSRQFGVEDQGWVAWFIIALALEKKLSIYGNGKQVRDILYIEDLLNAYDMAAEHIKTTKGQIYNIGGGIKNTMSIWFEFQPILEKLFKQQIVPDFKSWRPGDQPIFISDIRKAANDFGWKPKIGIHEGIEQLYNWVTENKNLFS